MNKELCKIITKKGTQYVCMPDGTVLPMQLSSTVRQDLGSSRAGEADVECRIIVRPWADQSSAYACNEADQVIALGERLIPGVTSVRLYPRRNDTENDEAVICLRCTLDDTIPVVGATAFAPNRETR